MTGAIGSERDSGLLPSPSVAQAAALEARRRLCASRGLFMAVLGGYNLVGAVVLGLLVHLETLQDLVLGIWSLGMGLFSLLVPLWIQRARAREGIQVVPKGEFDSSSGARPALKKRHMTFMLAGALSGLLLAAWFVISPETENPANWKHVVGGFMAVFSMFSLWTFWRLGLWEFLVTGATALCAGILFVRLELSQFGWVILALGAGSLVAGLSLHLRWRKWVQAFPMEA